MNSLSIIVPVLNEVYHIERVVKHALAPASIQPEQILIVDGGSSEALRNLPAGWFLSFKASVVAPTR